MGHNLNFAELFQLNQYHSSPIGALTWNIFATETSAFVFLVPLVPLLHNLILTFQLNIYLLFGLYHFLNIATNGAGIESTRVLKWIFISLNLIKYLKKKYYFVKQWGNQSWFKGTMAFIINFLLLMDIFFNFFFTICRKNSEQCSY